MFSLSAMTIALSSIVMAFIYGDIIVKCGIARHYGTVANQLFR